MAYTVYSGDRCVRSAFDCGRCALTDGHHGLHTTAAGGRFSTQGGKYLSGDPLRRPTAGQKVTGEPAPDVRQTVLRRGRSYGEEAIQAMVPAIRRVAQKHGRSDLELNWYDMAANAFNAVWSYCEQFDESVAAVPADRIDAVSQASQRIAGDLFTVKERITELEQKFHDSRRYTNLVERIERIERDLRDTHDLAERAATAHLERKPEQWDADSAEPPRDQLYVDTDGAVWKHTGDGWHGVPVADIGMWADDDGWQWHELASGRNDDPRGITPTPDFPWKVWTNG